jgi:hypothetical protein
MRIVALLLALVLCGCAGQPRAWIKADGTTPTSADLRLAMTACRGEVQKVAVQGQAISTVNSPLGMDRQDRQI